MNRILNLVKDCVWTLLKKYPGFRSLVWQNLYGRMGLDFAHRNFTHINLGYAKKEILPFDLASMGLHYFSEELYRSVLGANSLDGLDVLEVGCGRGGGAYFLNSLFTPKSYIGVDQQGSQIQFCNQTVSKSGVRFKVDRAEKLGFSQSSFDAVINVESSHCYTSRELFFKSVYRILKDSGRFYITDVFNPDLDPLIPMEMEELLKKAGFQIVEREDITENVLYGRSLAAHSPALMEAFNSWSECDDVKLQSLYSIFCFPGSVGYSRLKNGTMPYWRWILRK